MTPFSADSELLDESALKGAFLNYFLQLIRWPEVNLQNSIRFCAMGKNQVTSVLKELASARDYENLIVTFAYISSPKDAIACDYVFIDSHHSDFALPIIATTRGRAILTVSEIDGFAAAGGVIELARKNTKVAVRINVDALAQQGLQASSKLLSVAERLSGRGGK